MRAQPGDVVLYPANASSRAFSSRAVAAGELLAGVGGRGHRLYSHAAVLAYTPGWQYEAKFPLTGRFPIDTSRRYEIWKLGHLDQAARIAVLKWCSDHCGYPYDLFGVLTFGLLRMPWAYYCSEFACRAYAAAGRHPGDLVLSPDSITKYPGARMVDKGGRG